MDRRQQLLARLDEIGQSLAQTSQALALLGLGSVGIQLDRIDDYSDLDFFVIVKPGQKFAFIQKLDWLESVCPVVFSFQNTADGHKALYEDGIFCEFAVFEPDELANMPFAEGRIVWKADGVDDALRLPQKRSTPSKQTAEWQLGEALTNLYVGLGRYWRGEKLSAARFIQGYAVDRLLDLSALVETEEPAYRDLFTPERRYEQRFPQTAALLPQFIQGYERSPESARAILEFLGQHFQVNPHLKKMILELCRHPDW
jgi:lincosamide nucleotidyltransferase